MKKLTIALFSFFISANALADLVLCNLTTGFDKLALSIGTYAVDAQGKTMDAIDTFGWYHLGKNTCLNVLHGDLRQGNGHFFFRVYGVKGTEHVIFKSIETKTFNLCAIDNGNFKYQNSDSSIQCGNQNGKMLEFNHFTYDKTKKDVVYNVKDQW